MPRPHLTRLGLPTTSLERARVAVGAAFALNGFAFASWISRTPALRQALELSPSQLGLLLLCVSVGAVVALPGSGPLVQRIGPGRAVLGGACLVAVGLLVLSAGVSRNQRPLAGGGLLLIGVGTSVWDVAMNVEGAAVEHRLQRPLMPRFHAGFSLGTVAGALVGATAAARALPMQTQLILTAIAGSIAVSATVRLFLAAPPPTGLPRAAPKARAAWRERRTLLIGIMVLAFAFTEGTANDWLTLALVDGHDASSAVGAVGFAVFVTGMTVARLTGGTALDRWGRVPVLRAAAALACAGVVLVVLGPSLLVAGIGALFWGIGVALGFPVGVSAAADDPSHAAVRISVVTSIGYTAFLAGPPLIGFIAAEVGVLHALVVVLGALTAAVLTAEASRAPVCPRGEATAGEP